MSHHHFRQFPGFWQWWHERAERHCESHAEGPEGERQHHGPRFSASEPDFGGGGFGVRRPLRFLAHKLDLDEKQVAELAKIISDLKTERAQGDVDNRRALSLLADSIGGAAFEEARAKEAGALRVTSAERLRDAVGKALGRIHALLADEQRAKLAYLIRTGVVTL